MSLSDSELRSLQATEKRYKKSCGDSLFVVVEPISKGGGKSFVGRRRFPPGRKSPLVDVRIGVYGKGVGFQDSDGACHDFKKAASPGHQYRINWFNSKEGAWCRNMR